MLRSEYTTSCFIAKTGRMTQLSEFNIRQTFHCFALNSNFIQPSVCKYVLFVCFLCLPDCKYLLFPCISDTLAEDFLSAQLIYRGKVKLCNPFYDFRGKRIKIIFCGRCRPRKLKSAKNNRHVFETKSQKFGDAKISHYTVSRKRTIKVLIRMHGCAG